jgi:hypothetical protein
LQNVTTDANKAILKIMESGNNLSAITRFARPEIMVIEMLTNDDLADISLGLMNPRKDGSVLYSIPKIINIGKSSHN